MELNLQNGFVQNIAIVASPHFNQRPANTTINLLVIHNISLPPGQFGGQFINDLFLGQLQADAHPSFNDIADLKVSAHFLINRTGNITQYVSCFNRAWHAGKSIWQGQKNCNDFSLGIELEGSDNIAYTNEQYQQLTALTQLLQQHFPDITKERIVGHSDIAPERKTDPGPAFDWLRFKTLL